MPMEALFEHTHDILLGLIILVIAAVVVTSVLAAAGVFEGRQVYYDVGLQPPEVVCSGGVLYATFSNVTIQTGPQNIAVMPVLMYHGAIGYNESNLIQLRNGKGVAALAFRLEPESTPEGGQSVWLTLTLWKWSPGGCLNQTASDPEAKYVTLIGNCAVDFIMSESVNASNTC